MIVLNIILAVLWTCFVILPGAIKYNYSAAKGVFHVRNLFDGRVCSVTNRCVYTVRSSLDRDLLLRVGYSMVVMKQNTFVTAPIVQMMHMP